MYGQYLFMKRVAELYNLLEDELSKKLFWARMKYDVNPSIESAIELFGTAAQFTHEEWKQQYNFKYKFKEILSNGGKLFFYGAGVCGRGVAELVINDGGDFSGFCDRNAEKYTNGFCGKKVYSLQEALAQGEEIYFVVTTIEYYDEILEFLIENGIEKNNILPFLGRGNFDSILKKEYFEYPELFEPGTAFVDGGCYDCTDSFKFVKWCNGNYSRIFAFEPDNKNFVKCKKVLEENKIFNFELVQAGLGKETGTVTFATAGGTESHVIDDTDLNNRNFDYVDFSAVPMETIKIEALDSIVGDTQIGFMKLDIEGAEYDALHGARNTLLRDKPLLAICLYHKQGDMVAIMDYLHELIPEYHFRIRHYSTMGYDTVLYASVKEFPDI